MREYRLLDISPSRLKLVVWRQQSSPMLHESEHRHDCIEMMYVVGGAGICRVSGQPYPASRGDLFVMSPQDTHEFVAEQSFIYYNIMFSPDLFAEEELEQLRRFACFRAWLEDRGGEKKYQLLPPCCDVLEELFRAAAEEFKFRPEGFELGVKAAFVRSLLYLLRQLDYLRLHQGASTHESVVARAVHYIDRRCHGPITAADIAREAGVSASTLTKIFKRATGDSLFDYIGKIRIGKAQFEMEHTGKSLSQIAAELGYYDSSYFSRAFRRYTGISPREYRNRVRGVRNMV